MMLATGGRRGSFCDTIVAIKLPNLVIIRNENDAKGVFNR